MNKILRVVFLGGGALLTIVWLGAGLLGGQWLTAWLAGPILLAIAAIEWRTWGLVDDAFGPDEDGNDFFAKHSDSQKAAFQHLPLGVGHIIALHSTGTQINDEPQYDVEFTVETQDGRTIRGITTEVLERAELYDLRPGVTVLVRYDPRDAADPGDPEAPQRVAFALDVDEQQEIDAKLAVERAHGRLSAEGEHTFRSGIAAEAVVRSCAPTGELHGSEPIVDLALTVHRPDGSTFDVTTRDHFGPPALEQLVVGNMIEVRYDPADEEGLALVFTTE